MEDNQIVALFWERSESAITETSKKYRNYCRSIAMNILANNEDAEECISDTLLQAWNSMPENRPALLSSYLGKITRNLAINKYKKRRAEKRGGGETELVLDELEDCVTSKTNVENEIDKEHLAKLISCFLRTLPEESMIIFMRRYWYCDSISAVSIRYNISESKTKSILFRCRNKLKLFLESEGITA